MNSQAVGENNRSGRATKAKTVTFYRSGDVNFSGLRMAIAQKNYRTFETLLDELTKKVSLPQGARRVHTPGGVHSVTSVEDLEDGKSYVVTSSKKLKPLNLDNVQKQRVWVPTKKSVPNGTVSKNNQNGPKKPAKTKTTPKEKTPPTRDTLSSKLPPTPKKIMVMKNGDIQTKHMMLLNRRTAQNFEDILQDISEIFKLPVKKLCTPDGSKIESLQAIFNGPEVFVALSATERFRALNYLENSPFKASRSRERLRRKSEDSTDQPPAKITKKSKGKWRVWIATNENPAAGTDATVYMVVYGDKGKTDDIILGAGDGYFEAGNEDEFTIQIGDVGEIYKIRIGHDDSTEFPGWKCDEVRMQDVHTGEELIFICDRWMSRDEDDSDICRELAVSRDEDPLAVVKYQVLVTTGNYWGAGLVGKVYVTLIGERGDSGPRLLYKSNRDIAFEKGRTDIFSLEAVSLEKLKGILIGHDCDEPEKGWFLDKVVVKETEGAKKECLFPCYQWLDVAKGDGAITREISVSTKPVNFENEMWEQEKWKFESGNHVMLIHKASGKALQVTSSGVVEAVADPSSKTSTAYFVVETLKNNICIFSSASNSNQILAMDGSKASMQAKNGPMCEFKVRVQIDSTLALESNKSTGQLIAFNAGGKPTDGRGTIGPSKLFYCYVKGMFRNESVIIFYTSRTQTLMLDNKGDCLATGERNENAYWKVHKIKEGGIRMFENLSMPDSFLQIKNGACNAKGDGDDSCHFIVHKVKDKGCVKLQALTTPESFVGFAPDGSVIPVEDDEKNFMCMSPAIVQVGITKKRPTPTPPTTPRPANRKKRAPLKKRKSTDQIEKESLPSKVPKKDEKTSGNDKSSIKKNKESKSKPDPKARVKKVSVVPEKPGKESSTEEETVTKQPPEPLGEEKSFYEDGDWKVWVKTGTTGTKSPVVLVVYGENKTSEPIRLGKGGDLFTTGAENDFKVNLADFGDIYKIRVGLDTTNKKAAWRLDQVKMKDMNSGQQLTFKFKNRWLAMREDDGSLWREAAAVRPGTKPLPIYKYSVQVTTGWEPGSGTDANVYITLNGEKGDTGKRLLHKSEKELFQEGQINKFELEAVSAQKLKSIVLEHDGKGSGAGWYCKEVVIKESKDSKSEYIFQCNRWLDEGQDDKLIKREFSLTEKRKIKENDWHVYITTGEEEDSSLTGPVTLYVYGDKEHKEITLSPTHDKGFISGSLEDFRVNVGDLGKLSKIRIGHNGLSQEESWFLKLLKLVDMNSGTIHEIEANRWLSQNHDDLDVWREFPVAQEGKKPVSAIKYHVQVFTGSESDSNTEANIYIHMFGKHSDSGPRKLLKCKNNKKKFQVGQMDLFEIEAVNLGKLQKVVVGHDGKEKGEGWYLEKIIIKESKNAKNEFFFSCKRWLDAGQDDGKIERELTVGKAPAAPNCVSSETASTTTDTITVSWEPPPTVTGYKVNLDPPDAPTSEIISSDAKLKKAVFEKLSPGVEYQVDIIAVNGELESNKVSLKSTTKPNKVLNLQGDSTEDTLTVSWDKPEGGIHHFKARINPEDAKKSTIKTKDGETTTAKFTGLKSGKKYKVEVRTVVGDVESEIVAVTVTTKAAEVNVPPVSNQTLAATSDTIKVSWTKPSDDITGYLVVFHPLDGESKEMNIVDPEQLEAEFSSLTPGLECSVDIIPLIGDKQGEKVTLKGRTELPKVPKVESVEADCSSNAIKVTWQKPNGEISEYRLTCDPKKGSKSDKKEIKLKSPEELSATFDDLKSETDYVIKIFSVHEGRESERVKVAAKTKPSALLSVTDLSAKEITTNVAEIKWTKVEGDITGYHVTAVLKSKPEEIVKEMKIENAAETETKLDGLMDDEEYLITVVVLEGDKKGEAATLDIKTKPEKVDKVHKASAECSETSLTVSWKKPDGVITGYHLTCSVGEEKDAEVKELTLDDPEVTQAVFEKLSPETDYVVKIYAKNGKKKSERVKVKGKTKSLALPEVVNPSSEVTDNSFTVTWGQPEGDVKGYVVSYKPISDESVEETEIKLDEPEKTEVKVDGLEPGVQYKVLVHVNCGERKSEGISLTVETVSEAPVKPVTDLKSDVSGNTINLTWVKPKDCPITGYKIEYMLKDGEEETKQELNVEDAEAISAAVTELEPGKEYLLDVYTLNREKQSEKASLEVKLVSDSLPEVKPVSELKAEPSQNAIALTWVNPEDSPITGFKVIYMIKDEEESKNEVIKEETDSTSTSITELESGKEYLIEVYTLDGDRASERVSIEVKTEVEKVDRVHKASAECSETSLTVSWKKPDGVITGYHLTCSVGDEKDAEVKELTLDDPEVTQAVFEELSPETDYVVKIYAKNGKKKSERVKVKGKTKKRVSLQPVTDLKGEPSQNAIALTWVKPADGPVTGYKIIYLVKDEEESKKEMLVEDAETLSTSILELEGGKEYLIEVYTLDGDTLSEKATVTIKTEDGQDLTPVKKLEAKGTRDKMNVTWKKPSENVTGYKVVYYLTSLNISADGSRDDMKTEDADTTKEKKEETENRDEDKNNEKETIDKDGEDSKEEEAKTENEKKVDEDVGDEPKDEEKIDGSVEAKIGEEEGDKKDETGKEEEMGKETEKDVNEGEQNDEVDGEEVAEKKEKEDGEKVDDAKEGEDEGKVNEESLKKEGDEKEEKKEVEEKKKSEKEADDGEKQDVVENAEGKEGVSEEKSEGDGKGKEGSEGEKESKGDDGKGQSEDENKTEETIASEKLEDEGVKSEIKDDAEDGNLEKKYQSQESKKKIELLISDGDTCSAVLENLEKSSEYTVEVCALYGDSVSQAVVITASTTEEEVKKVDRVHKASAECSETSLTVSWKKPDGVITGYHLTCSVGEEKDAEVKELTLDDPEVTQAVFEELSPETDYVVKIYAKNGKKKSERVKVKGKTKSETKLKSVTETASQFTDDVLYVTWKKLDDLTEVKGYKVTCRPTGEEDGDTVVDQITDDGMIEAAEFKDLDSSKVYEVIVYTLYNDGEEIKGDMVLTASGKDQVGEPKAISTTSTIHLTWIKPKQNNLEGYLVSYSAPGGVATEIKIDDPDTTEATIEYLVAGREYHCEIKAIYEEEQTSQRVILTQRTKPHLPSNIHFTKIATDSLALKWEQPTGDLTGYLVEYEPVSIPKVFEEEQEVTGEKTETNQEDDGTKEENDNSEKQELLLEAKQDEAELIGLRAGQLYCITLCSKSQSEMGEIHTLEQYTKPEMVQDLTATVAATSIYASWKSPASGGLTGYLVTCSSGGSDDVEASAFSKELTSDVTSIVFENLTENVEYEVEVFTISGEEKSDGCSHLVTTLASHDVPQAQDSCVVSSRNSLTVKWKAPDFDALTGYEINCFERGKLMENKDGSVEQTDDSGTVAQGVSQSEEENNIKAATADEEMAEVKKDNGGVSEETIDGKSEKEEDSLETATELVLKKEENGDSGVSSEVDEGKLSSPQKSRLGSVDDGKEVFTTVLDIDQTEIVIDGLKAGTDYRVEITCLCEERKSEVVVLEAKTKTKPPPILSIQHKSTQKDISLSWSTPPLDFTGYEAVCYKVLPSSKKDEEEETSSERQENAEFESQGDTAESKKQPTSHEKAAGNKQMDDGEIDLELIEITRKTEIATKTLPPESTEVMFPDLETDTLYWVEIFTLHGDIKNEAGEVAVRTQKVIKPLEVLNLALEADANALTLTWTQPDCEVTGYMVNIVRPSNPDELVVEDMSSTEEDKPADVGENAESKEESKEGKDDKEGAERQGEKEGLKLERKCQEAETGELVECLVKGDVLELRRLEADQTSVVFGNLDPGTVYALHVASLCGEVTSDWVHLVGKTTAEDSLLPVIDLKSESTRETIKLSWSPPDGIVTGYRIRCFPKDGGECDPGVDKDSPKEGDVNNEDGETSKSQEGTEDGKDTNQTKSKEDESENTEKGEEKAADQSEGTETVEDKTLDQLEGAKDTPDDSETIVNDIGAEMSSHDLTGLTPCTDYVIKVWTLNGEAESDVVEIQVKTKGDWTVTLTTHDDTPPSQNATLHLSMIGTSSVSEENIVLSKKSETLQAGENERQILSKELDDIFKIRLEAKDVDLESFQGIRLKEVLMKHNVSDKELVFKGDAWLRRGIPHVVSGKDEETSEENGKEKAEKETPADKKTDEEKKDGETNDAEKQDGETDDAEKKDGEKKDGETNDAVKKDGETDDAEKKNGETDDAEKKDGEKKDGETNDAVKKDGETDDAEKKEVDEKEADEKEADEKAADEKEAEGASKEDGDKTSDEVKGEDEERDVAESGEKHEADNDVKDEDDLVVELPLYKPDGTTLPVLKYKLEIYTKDEDTASTSANVFATVHGSTGDTGRRELWGSDKDVKFMTGQVDTFYIQAVDIGTISKLILGHDGQTQNDDWKVEKVLASISSDPSSQIYFACDQWFSVEKDDKLTERTLEPSDLPGETEANDPPQESEVSKEKEDEEKENKNDEEKEAEAEEGKENTQEEKEKEKLEKEDKTEEEGKEDESKGEGKETEKQEEKKDEEEKKGEDSKDEKEKETDGAKDDVRNLEEDEEQDYVQDEDSDA